jgi:hypothetical protein
MRFRDGLQHSDLRSFYRTLPKFLLHCRHGPRGEQSHAQRRGPGRQSRCKATREEAKTAARTAREAGQLAPGSARVRARALVRKQLVDGPKPEAHVVAAAPAAGIPERSLIRAASARGVRTRHGQWWLLPSHY